MYVFRDVFKKCTKPVSENKGPLIEMEKRRRIRMKEKD